MATRVDLPPLPQFDPLSDQSSLSQRWKSWTKRFETYLVAANITDDQQKRAMVLYQAGSATFLRLWQTPELTTPRPKESWTTTSHQRRIQITKYSSFVKPHNCLVKVSSSSPPDYARLLSTVSSMTSIEKSSRQSYRTVVRNV